MASGRNIGQRLRLISGLVMFVFVTSHLLNHALGMVSLEMMQAAQGVFLAVWMSIPGSVLLLVSFLVHVTLVSWKLIERRTWRMPPLEILRALLGLAVLLLLTAHVFGNYVMFRLPGVETSYSFYFFKLWPGRNIRQTLLLITAWTHGCIGIHSWLRIHGTYRKIVPVLFAAALLLPGAAIAGILSAAKEASLLGGNQEWAAKVQSTVPKPDPELSAVFNPWYKVPSFILGGLAIILLSSRLTWILRSRRRRIEIRYPLSRIVPISAGTTILEASRLAGIPHASICGGRGRCSTCRVQVLDAEVPPEPEADEAELLGRIAAPPGVRLACQYRPVGDVSVVPLVSPGASSRDALPDSRHLFGHEMEITILFSDLRGFTSLSEQKLPFDVVHILNQYFDSMGRAIETNGGFVDKFIGDGIMALFGLRGSSDHGASSALLAARDMSLALEELNKLLADDLPSPLRMGIGIHSGNVIVGKMGRQTSSSLTAIGDPVNVASRLEALTKRMELRSDLLSRSCCVRRNCDEYKSAGCHRARPDRTPPRLCTGIGISDSGRRSKCRRALKAGAPMIHAKAPGSAASAADQGQGRVFGLPVACRAWADESLARRPYRSEFGSWQISSFPHFKNKPLRLRINRTM